jgi:hypothetical protein
VTSLCFVKNLKNILKFAFILGVVIFPACKDGSNFKGRSKNIPPTVTVEFIQDEYPINEETFIQGKAGQVDAEQFNQGEFGKLDLLLVVDNSGSMEEEQQNLSTKLESLLSRVDKSDWQIAVTTTDSADGCRQGLIRKSDTNAKSEFSRLVNQGTNGDGVERGISQAVRGLSSNCLFTSKWLRDDSAVAVLFISDEDNCSIDSNGSYGCQGEAGLQSTHLGDYLKSIRTLGTDARVYGLIWHPTQTQAQCTTGTSKGNAYAQLIEESKGMWGSICDADYSKTLTAISEDVAKILKLEHVLAKQPTDGTLKVLVDGSIYSKWTLEGNKVTFTEPPPFGTSVEFAYRHGKEGEIVSDFKVGDEVTGDPVAIEVDGSQVSDSDYQWDPATGQVVFNNAPADQTAVTVKYKKSVPLKREFDIGTSVHPKTLKVTFDGAKTKAFIYDKSSGMIVFDPEPPELTKIVVTYVSTLE